MVGEHASAPSPHQTWNKRRKSDDCAPRLVRGIPRTAGTLLWGAEAIRPARDAARRMNFNHRTGEPYIPVPEHVTKRHWRSGKTFAQIHDPLG
jgi:hypothetical protein